MITLTFPFKCISKDNEKVFNKQGRFFLSAKFKAFESHIAWEAKSQYKGRVLEGSLMVYLKAYFKDKRHCDASNLFKGVLDSLQGVIYKNDRQIKKATVEIFYWDREGFKIMIEETKSLK